MKTTVKPCVRFVLVRNAQCKKHLDQQKGDFSDAASNKPSILTDQGEEMALALGGIMEYLDARPFCVPDSDIPTKHYHLVIDSTAPQHDATAGQMRITQNLTIKSSSNIVEKLTSNDLHVHPEGIDVYIVFTNAATISTVLREYLGLENVGVALGSTTIFDVVPYHDDFIHTIGSLEVLQYGGFDTTKLFWWNNAP